MDTDNGPPMKRKKDEPEDDVWNPAEADEPVFTFEDIQRIERETTCSVLFLIRDNTKTPEDGVIVASILHHCSSQFNLNLDEDTQSIDIHREDTYFRIGAPASWEEALRSFKLAYAYFAPISGSEAPSESA